MNAYIVCWPFILLMACGQCVMFLSILWSVFQFNGIPHHCVNHRYAYYVRLAHVVMQLTQLNEHRHRKCGYEVPGMTSLQASYI
jgi:hypothetical protein